MAFLGESDPNFPRGKFPFRQQSKKQQHLIVDLQSLSCHVLSLSDPTCEEADIAGNGTASWQSTLTSLEGDVTCDTDFMYTNVDTALRCHGNGTWDAPIGQCMQYYFRNVSWFVHALQCLYVTRSHKTGIKSLGPIQATYIYIYMYRQRSEGAIANVLHLTPTLQPTVTCQSFFKIRA